MQFFYWTGVLLEVFPKKTSEEIWSDRRPFIGRLRVFEGIACSHVPDQLKKKLDEKREKCVFIGYNEVFWTYRLHNLIVSKDVTFDERDVLNWSTKSPKVAEVTLNNQQEEIDNDIQPSPVA